MLATRCPLAALQHQRLRKREQTKPGSSWSPKLRRQSGRGETVLWRSLGGSMIRIAGRSVGIELHGKSAQGGRWSAQVERLVVDSGPGHCC